jgi:(2Fe-2S) ferredoxin
MPKFQKHIFICTNQREPGHPRGSCDPDGKGSFQKKFKQKLSEHGVGNTVRANKSGCLEQCEHGQTIVVYPEAVWYGFVKDSDIDQIIESHIIGGKPVERLALADHCLNTPRCEHRPEPGSKS